MELYFPLQTYNQDFQTPDSAGTATAFLCGIKTNKGVLGLDARSRKNDCGSAEGTSIESIAHLSIAQGTSTFESIFSYSFSISCTSTNV